MSIPSILHRRAELTPRDKHFERFEDHTKVKHFLLASYLKALAVILLEGGPTGRGRRFKRIVFVDAFAGAGCDAEGHPGSPLLAAQIATEVNERLFDGSASRDTGMQVIAVEEDKEYFESLEHCLASFTGRAKAFVFARQGQLDSDMFSNIRKFAPSDPMLVFLDPFGIGGLDASLLRQLLAQPHTELLMLFHDEAVVRLDAKGKATPTDPSLAIEGALAQASLFGPEHDATRVLEAERRAARQLAGHKSNPNARAIMRRAFGNLDHEPILDAAPIELRQEKAIELYSDLLKRSGASHVLRFAVDTRDGRHKYTLLHASKEPAAFAAMKDAMYRARRFAGAEGPQLVADTDLRPIVQQIAAQFVGGRVRWTGEEPSVKAFALRETALMYHELDALKRELAEYSVVKKPLTFEF